MASRIQTQRSEGRISVDLSEPNPEKAVDRRRPVQAARQADPDDEPQRQSTAEQKLFRRMNSLEKNLTRSFEQKQADQEARHQRELSALKEDNERLRLEREDGAQAAEAHETAMAILTKELEAAVEKGDSAAQAIITAKMIKADGEYHAKLSGTKQRADGTKTTPAVQAQPAEQRRTGPTAAGARFIKANEQWWDDEEYAVEMQAASQIYVKLTQNEGFEANSDETFKEVAKRMRAKFPNLALRTHGQKSLPDDPDADPDADGDDEGDEDDQPQRRAPVSRAADRGPQGPARRFDQRRTLTAAEIKTMRDVGLNPDNDKDVVAFTREIQAADAARV